jgi:hypothetical protein
MAFAASRIPEDSRYASGRGLFRAVPRTDQAICDVARRVFFLPDRFRLGKIPAVPDDGDEESAPFRHRTVLKPHPRKGRRTSGTPKGLTTGRSCAILLTSGNGCCAEHIPAQSK